MIIVGRFLLSNNGMMEWDDMANFTINLLAFMFNRPLFRAIFQARLGNSTLFEMKFGNDVRSSWWKLKNISNYMMKVIQSNTNSTMNLKMASLLILFLQLIMATATPSQIGKWRFLSLKSFSVWLLLSHFVNMVLQH